MAAKARHTALSLAKWIPCHLKVRATVKASSERLIFNNYSTDVLWI